jgi:outer membrane lipoprotein-sorting protein
MRTKGRKSQRVSRYAEQRRILEMLNFPTKLHLGKIGKGKKRLDEIRKGKRGMNGIHMKWIEITVVLLCVCAKLCALSAEEIIQRVDDNRVYTSIEYQATMTISMGDKVREKSFFGYARGEDHAYIEFIAPARDKGTRFLKLGEEMWMYIPAVEKPTKIAGHMLRQSLMGSDFSYDDFTENDRLIELYDIELIGVDTIEDRPCYVLELVAKVEEVTYYRQKLWVSQDDYIPIKTELYARSGKLMKEFRVLETKVIGSYNFPVRIKMTNKLRQSTFTELVFQKIDLDVSIPSNIFTKAYLERK